MTEPIAQTEPRPAAAKRFLHLGAMQRLLAFGALIVLFVGFSLASPNFLQFDNVVGILLATTVNGVLALGVTFVIITGGIDLSVGTVMTLSTLASSTHSSSVCAPAPRGPNSTVGIPAAARSAESAQNAAPAIAPPACRRMSSTSGSSGAISNGCREKKRSDSRPETDVAADRPCHEGKIEGGGPSVRHS